MEIFYFQVTYTKYVHTKATELSPQQWYSPPPPPHPQADNGVIFTYLEIVVDLLSLYNTPNKHVCLSVSIFLR